MDLTIGILTVPARAANLERLLGLLKVQQAKSPLKVEVAVLNGPGTRGGKRQQILADCRGEYICFIDDDDIISDDYLWWIGRGLFPEKHVWDDSTDRFGRSTEFRGNKGTYVKVGNRCIRRLDCLGFMLRQNWNNRFIYAEHSISNRVWRTSNNRIIGGEGLRLRCPNHLNPIRTELCRQVGGYRASLHDGEDYDFSMRVLSVLRSEIFVKEILYYYLFTSAKPT